MPDQIDKDDEKFNQMIVKQHPTADSFFKTQSKDKDAIEKDDEKMDELLTFQSMTEDVVEYGSIEEKYEEHLMMDEITKIIERQMEQHGFREVGPDNPE
jgi:hypothetical protein